MRNNELHIRNGSYNRIKKLATCKHPCESGKSQIANYNKVCESIVSLAYKAIPLRHNNA